MIEADRKLLNERSTRVETADGRRLRVFINYRNEDYPGVAWPLYLQIAHQMPEADVFFDNVTLRPGEDWFEEIKRHAKGAGVFLSLVGPRWLECLADRMHRGGDDYVVKEIDLALRSGPQVRVIPVLVGDTAVPDPDILPPAIKTLFARHVGRIRQRNLLEDVNELLKFIAQAGPKAADADRVEASPAALDGGVSMHVRIEDAQLTRRPEQAATRPRLAPAPDEQHYDMVVQKAANLVVFVGAGANTDERDGRWRGHGAGLPDDKDLARYLANHAGMETTSVDLAEVAQYARAIHGDSELFDWLNQILRIGDDMTPGPVHRALASLPRRLAKVHGRKCYQLIVTPKYDAALELAFREAGEEFDVVVYMGPGTEGEGWFRHLPWAGEPRTISKPNEYFDLPIDRERRRLTRSVIVRVNGAGDDRREQFPADNFVITEDNYIDYLSGRSAAQVVPTQILATLKRANYLFLGYAFSDWRLRVFLHRVWEGQQLGGQNYWAVERAPERLTARLWTQAGVTLLQSDLVEYMGALCQTIDTRRAVEQ